MKIGPISGDAVLMLGVGGAALIAVAYLVNKASNVLPSAQTIENAVNPVSTSNLAYTGVNAIGNAIADTAPTANGRSADGSWSLGAWIYDVTHGGQVQP